MCEGIEFVEDIASLEGIESVQDFVIEKISLEQYLEQFDPKIQDILRRAYGDHLETMPQAFDGLKIEPQEFMERLLNIRLTRSQELILKRVGITTGIPVSTQEVADEFGCTVERVRAIELRFMRRREFIRRRRMRDFLDSIGL